MSEQDETGIGRAFRNAPFAIALALFLGGFLLLDGGIMLVGILSAVAAAGLRMGGLL